MAEMELSPDSQENLSDTKGSAGNYSGIKNFTSVALNCPSTTSKTTKTFEAQLRGFKFFHRDKETYMNMLDSQPCARKIILYLVQKKMQLSSPFGLLKFADVDIPGFITKTIVMATNE